MYLRPIRKTRPDGTVLQTWALVESVRTARGPRQRTVAYLGDLAEEVQRGVQAAATATRTYQPDLFAEAGPPEWVEVDLKSLRVERTVQFGGPWIGQRLLDLLGLPACLDRLLSPGREEVPWARIAEVLILARLLEPSSELYLAEQLYARTALADLFGISESKLNDDRLYRALDQVLPHKAALEQHLKEKAGELFGLTYDLLLYDVTSTYFEGLCAKNAQAKRGYSRDNRPDCLQVCIALVVSREGMPLGYEVFDGNRPDVTTVEDIVTLMEDRYGTADRVWVMDRGMASEDNLAFLQEEGRRYIIGAPRSELKQFEAELLAQDWAQIRAGLEVKRVPSPEGDETFILCRSVQRQAKEQAMHQRCIDKIEAGLRTIETGCAHKKQTTGAVERRIGRLLERYSHAAALFKITTHGNDDGKVSLLWYRDARWQAWAALSEGCYLLRSNIADWNAEDLWQAYIQLTQAEAAFRIQKSDLQLHPIWHQKTERVQAHLLVCFLAYVLWKTLGLLAKAAGLGDEPRRIWDELAQIMLVDVVVRTRTGVEIRKRCVAQPTPRQAQLLQRLRFVLPRHLSMTRENVVTKIADKIDGVNVNSGKMGR
jgi:transposase